ncbi:MAG: AIM24 family protein [Clostridia bacterium]|nr:AIM24 family protein [Clostridia bacterium]
MVQTNLFENTPAHQIVDKLGNFSILEYTRDLSVTSSSASTAYFMSKMNVRKRQLVIELKNTGAIMQAGAMQMMLGNVNASTNIQGAGDFFKKMVGGKVTGESGIKPKYTGIGHIILEPTYKHIILQSLEDWGGAITIEDGLFLACDDTVQMKVTARTNFSSAVAGGEGLFNNTLFGKGVFALESDVPASELLIFDLDNDVLKIDGSMAIAWTHTLNFTVERTTKSLVGSAASGEGLVNVYRGTGRVLVAPVT